MVAYETEEQQVEALKAWWKENGKSVIFGVVVGIAGLFGWQSWQQSELRHAETASERYEQLVVALESDEGSSEGLAEQLKSEFKDTPYAALAALRLAKVAYEKGDKDAAKAQLTWVAENAVQRDLPQVARLRLIRILIEEGDLDQAQGLIPADLGGFAGLYEELRGDIALAKGDRANARQAYKAAMEAGPVNRTLLQMKIDDLGIAGDTAES